MSPFGPFYCVFRWDLSKFDYLDPSQTRKYASGRHQRAKSVRRQKYDMKGLGQEEGSPWANYLKKWTPTTAGRWFLDSKKRLGAKMLVVETRGKIVGINGIISERNSGKGRFFTGIVVSPGYRRRGIGSLLLHKTLSDLKGEGLRWAEVETIQGIPAAKYLYPKYGGTGIQVPA